MYHRNPRIVEREWKDKKYSVDEMSHKRSFLATPHLFRFLEPSLMKTANSLRGSHGHNCGEGIRRWQTENGKKKSLFGSISRDWFEYLIEKEK
jgi:hypothetical protein